VRFDVLASKLQCARTAIAQAESDLEAAINEVRSAPRWEKVSISEVLEGAFEELRRAKTELARIESIIAEGGT
jgi:acyl-CoA reductase-like NAD-dependent aldehyde dehydrogenase